MSKFDVHNAEQTVITQRYEALCPAGKKLHNEFGYHLDDIPNDPFDRLMSLMGITEYDEWLADLNEVKASRLDTVEDELGQALALLSELRDGSAMSEEQKNRCDALLNGEPTPNPLVIT